MTLHGPRISASSCIFSIVGGSVQMIDHTHVIIIDPPSVSRSLRGNTPVSYRIGQPPCIIMALAIALPDVQASASPRSKLESRPHLSPSLLGPRRISSGLYVSLTLVQYRGKAQEKSRLVDPRSQTCLSMSESINNNNEEIHKHNCIHGRSP